MSEQIDASFFATRILESLAEKRMQSRHNFFHRGGEISIWLNREASPAELVEAQFAFDELVRGRLIYQTSEQNWFAITDPGRESLKTGKFKEMFVSPKDGLIFLSHASPDQKAAVFLKAELEKRLPGVKVFLSCDPYDLKPGKQWSDEVRGALQRSSSLVVLATPSSIPRPWIWLEVGALWTRGHLVISACFSGLRMADLLSPLSHLQAIDLQNAQEFKVALEELAARHQVVANTEELESTIEKLKELAISPSASPMKRVLALSRKLHSIYSLGELFNISGKNLVNLEINLQPEGSSPQRARVIDHPDHAMKGGYSNPTILRKNDTLYITEFPRKRVQVSIKAEDAETGESIAEVINLEPLK